MMKVTIEDEFNKTDLTLTDGTFSIQYVDGMTTKTVGKITSGQYGKWRIETEQYFPIMLGLVNSTSTALAPLNHIHPNTIIVLVDYEWEPKKDQKTWVAAIKKTSEDLHAIWKYEYVLKLRNYFLKSMTDAQKAILIYHELLHIRKDGKVSPHHDVDDFSPIVTKFGVDWMDNPEVMNPLDLS